METFSIIFILALTFAAVFQLWLSKRHIRHIMLHQNQVPQAFANKISLPDHQKAAKYTIAGVKLGQLNEIIGTALLLFWTLGGGLNGIDQWLRSYALAPVWTGVAVIVIVTAISYLLDLPMSIYRTFVHEERFGFNRTTRGQFTKDQFLNFVIAFVINIPLLWVILTLMESAGEYWWFSAWLVVAGFMLLMMWAYPIFIAPLFNKFSPLEDETLKSTIEALLTRCGFTSHGIFVMDGSKRSSHGNAYFTGFGAKKRIVFFDTLLKSLSSPEIEAVLAHELGHFKHKHVVKRLVMILCLSLAALALLGWLIQQQWFFLGLGVEKPSSYMGLFLFLLVTPIFSIYFTPFFSFLSRRHEFQADAFAAKNANAQELINALVKLYQENANTLTPDPLYSAFHDSHPPAGIRVAHLQQTGRS